MTADEKKQKIKEIDLSVKEQGITITAALDAAGLSKGQYYAWRAGNGLGKARGRSAPKLIPLPLQSLPQASYRPMVAFIGSPEQVTQAIRSLQ